MLIPNGITMNLLTALHSYYADGDGCDMQRAHLVNDAMNGQEWALERITAALDAIDATRPDGAVPRGALQP